MESPNFDHWETLAAFHGTGSDRFYDVDTLVGGKDSLTDLEENAIALATYGAGVGGLDVIHIQSHIGFDSISMARRGARVTAVDFSPTALERASEIAQLAGVALDTVQSDSRDLPHSLDDRFDIAYATVGVLCWIDNLDQWMASATRVLRDGGRLVLVEIHPFTNVFGSRDPLIADFPYRSGVPVQWSGTGSYANPNADFITSTEEYAHSLSEIVNAVHNAGLSMTTLLEHDDMAYDPHGDILDLDDDGRYRFRIGVGPDGTRASASTLPIAFTLLATKRPAVI
ncbi:MAG TPA: class I SAM-dependent methyltransferase [Acidimicrobiales bacterium]